MAKRGEAKYIGVSAQDFIDFATKDLAEGDFRDGTRVPKKVRDSYAAFIGSLRPLRARIRHYVFVFDRFIFIKVEF